MYTKESETRSVVESKVNELTIQCTASSYKIQGSTARGVNELVRILEMGPEEFARWALYRRAGQNQSST